MTDAKRSTDAAFRVARLVEKTMAPARVFTVDEVRQIAEAADTELVPALQALDACLPWVADDVSPTCALENARRVLRRAGLEVD